MSYQEYPKVLYKAETEFIVNSKDEEKLAREDGYTDWHTNYAKLNAPMPEPTTPPSLDLDLNKSKLDKAK